MSKLVRLSLRENAFSGVPPCLAAATALMLLDLAEQKLSVFDEDKAEPPVQGLNVLNSLTRLRFVHLHGFSGAGVCQFRAANPNVNVIM